jgi:hypothetical protein
MTRERTERSVIHDTSDPRTPVIVKSVVYYLLSSIILLFLTHHVLINWTDQCIFIIDFIRSLQHFLAYDYKCGKWGRMPRQVMLMLLLLFLTCFCYSTLIYSTNSFDCI